MKSLVIYYSLEGNTRFIAETVASALNADLLELRPGKDIPSGRLSKYLWGGKAVMTGQKPALLPFALDPNAYELIVIGTPVWASTFAPALRSFFGAHALCDKKMALFCCHGGAPGRALARMRAALPGNSILAEIAFREPLSHNREASAAEATEWCREILTAAPNG